MKKIFLILAMLVGTLVPAHAISDEYVGTYCFEKAVGSTNWYNRGEECPGDDDYVKINRSGFTEIEGACAFTTLKYTEQLLERITMRVTARCDGEGMKWTQTMELSFNHQNGKLTIKILHHSKPIVIK